MTLHGEKRDDWTYDSIWKAWTRGEARIYPSEGEYQVSVNSVWEPGIFAEWEDAVKRVEEIEA